MPQPAPSPPSHLLLAQCDKPQGVWGTGPPVQKTLPLVHSQLANSSTPKLNVALNQNKTEVEFLNRVHLGRGLGPCREAEQIAHRFFENGLVVLNHSREDRQLRLRVASELAGAELLDLYDGNKSLPLDEGVLEVRVPAQAARIFVVQERD